MAVTLIGRSNRWTVSIFSINDVTNVYDENNKQTNQKKKNKLMMMLCVIVIVILY